MSISPLRDSEYGSKFRDPRGLCRQYGRVNTSQLSRVIGREAAGTPARHHERLGYTYAAAGSLTWRTNLYLKENFNVNSLNELNTVTRPYNSTMVVAGNTTSPATNVTVYGTGLTRASATRYADGTWAYFGAGLADGSNTFTAEARDQYGRANTNTTSAFLPASISYQYDLNGSLLTDARRIFSYDDENQLIQVIVTNGPANSTRSDFAYDGKMRRRIRFESAWVGSAWVTNTIVRYV